MALTGSTEETQIYEGNVYLIKIHRTIIQEVYVEKSSKTAYKLRKERSDGTWYIEWVSKYDFERNYVILELLNNLLEPPKLEVEKTKITINSESITKECPICGGSGRVPDNTVTSGQTTCPKCLGGGRVWE